MLTRGRASDYCVSLASGAAKGSATVLVKIARGRAVLQTHRIVSAKDFPVGANGVRYYCSGYLALPTAPAKRR